MVSRLALAAASVAFALALFEVGLRLVRYGGVSRLAGEHSLRGPHEERGWALAPNGEAYQRTQDYAVHVRTNAQGLRDRPHDYMPGPGVYRIVVLGDSFMEAYSVPLEASLPYRLQEELSDRRVEVVNLGVGGYGTAQEYLSLREEGMRYQPDLVVLAFYPKNDVLNNSYELQALLMGEDDLKVYGRPYATLDPQGELVWTPPDRERVLAYLDGKENKRETKWWRAFEPALLANLLEQGISRIRAGGGGRGIYDPNVMFGWPLLDAFDPDDPQATRSADEYRRVWDDAWRVTKRLIVETRDLAASGGAGFVVFLVPDLSQVDSDFRERVEAAYPGLALVPDKPGKELGAFCASVGIPFLDLSSAFRAVYEANAGSLYHTYDLHWNDAGHALATAELRRFIDDERLLPPALAGERQSRRVSESRP